MDLKGKALVLIFSVGCRMKYVIVSPYQELSSKYEFRFVYTGTFCVGGHIPDRLFGGILYGFHLEASTACLI